MEIGHVCAYGLKNEKGKERSPDRSFSELVEFNIISVFLKLFYLTIVFLPCQQLKDVCAP